MERQITLEQVVGAAMKTLRNSLYARMPGVILAYDPTTMTATVQPTLSDPRVDVDTGAIVFEPWPTLQGVPVAWPRFGGMLFAGPLEPGDPVVLEAWDLDPHPALAQGRSVTPANPNDIRRLSGSYWLVRPTDMTGPVEDAAATAAAFVLGVDGDPAQVRFSKGSVQVGLAGASVALAGGGAAVGRVGDAVAVTLTQVEVGTILDSTGKACSAPGPITVTGTITAGSPLVTSG